MPMAIAPMAYQQLLDSAGEVAVAEAAKATGVPLVVSTMSSRSLEEISEIGAAMWFQLYWLRDRDLVGELIHRAENLGCEALMITVDVPVMGRRLRDVRNDFTLPQGVTAANLTPVNALGAQSRRNGTSAVAEHTRMAFDPTLTWSDLEWIRNRTTLPLVVKGVLDADDARRAVETGAEAVVVSNHGGRQLDGAIPSITALPLVVAAVNGRAQVLMDSGIRSGTDILRALSLGAAGVLIGRPVLWGLATSGAHGVRQVLTILAQELEEALLLAGCPDSAAARRGDQ